MRLLFFWVCLSDHRPRFAHPESQLPEQSLALPYPQIDAVLPFDPTRQHLAVPQIPTEACLTGHLTQDRVDSLNLLLVQASWPPGAITLQKSSQPHLFKRMYPILNRSRCVPQQCRRFRARQTLRHEQHTVQSMIVARFIRSSDLVL